MPQGLAEHGQLHQLSKAEICKDHGEDLGEGCWISTRRGRPGHEDPAGQGLKTAVSSRLIGGNSQIYPRLGLLAENQELEPVFLSQISAKFSLSFLAFEPLLHILEL